MESYNDLNDQVFRALALQNKKIKEEWVKETLIPTPSFLEAQLTAVVSHISVEVITGAIYQVLQKAGLKLSFSKKEENTWLVNVVRFVPTSDYESDFSIFLRKIKAAHKSSDSVIIDASFIYASSDLNKLVHFLQERQQKSGKTNFLGLKQGDGVLSQQKNLSILNLSLTQQDFLLSIDIVEASLDMAEALLLPESGDGAYDSYI